MIGGNRMCALKNIVCAVIVIALGIVIGGCAGEIATYRFAKEGSDAYNATDYPMALKKWQAGLEQGAVRAHK